MHCQSALAQNLHVGFMQLIVQTRSMAARQCKHGHGGWVEQYRCNVQPPSCTHIAVVVTWEVEDLPLSGELQCLEVKAANPLHMVQAGAHVTTVVDRSMDVVTLIGCRNYQAQTQPCTPCLSL
jgi:hypothetical protein